MWLQESRLGGGLLGLATLSQPLPEEAAAQVGSKSRGGDTERAHLAQVGDVQEGLGGGGKRLGVDRGEQGQVVRDRGAGGPPRLGYVHNWHYLAGFN